MASKNDGDDSFEVCEDETETLAQDLSDAHLTKNEDEELPNQTVADDDDNAFSASEVQNLDSSTESQQEEQNNSDYGTPTGDSDEPLLDDLVDEEKLREAESSFTEEQLAERFETSKTYKQKGNDEFGHGEYRDSILTYTKGLLICPLKENDFRSILYSNRSAAKIKLGMKLGAIEDCTQALQHKPDFVRPLLRRAKLYEEIEKLDEALADYQKVFELDPSVREAGFAVQKLPEQITERNEKLKTEMLGKLKDLGNMVLKPFGLSTENFKLQQDPNSGGYSVNFTK